MGSSVTKQESKPAKEKHQPARGENHVVQLEMRKFFEEKCANMTPPFIPDDLKPFLKLSSPGVWIADPDDASHSLYRSASEELQNAIKRDEASEDSNGVRWIAVGHSGHGINSWAMHYYIAYKPLYIMWAMSFGGAYSDANEDSPRVSAGFEVIKKIFERTQLLVKQGKIEMTDCISHETDPFAESRWQVRLKGQVTKEGAYLMHLLEYLNEL
eukprot:TRINITY_DN10670_c0_g1_i1.p1 TRINITY_DN10670_c0_g1~~TRINITY_DN10670_c0_g1_i1.p1  ORF type:complete len:213 (+),score=20.38 TRINITY_DN10670_c0_g1_i1:3-641(+)